MVMTKVYQFKVFDGHGEMIAEDEVELFPENGVYADGKETHVFALEEFNSESGHRFDASSIGKIPEGWMAFDGENDTYVSIEEEWSFRSTEERFGDIALSDDLETELEKYGLSATAYTECSDEQEFTDYNPDAWPSLEAYEARRDSLGVHWQYLSIRYHVWRDDTDEEVASSGGGAIESDSSESYFRENAEWMIWDVIEDYEESLSRKKVVPPPAPAAPDPLADHPKLF